MRSINSICNRYLYRNSEKSNEKQNLCYVQGMNVLLGPILFVMPELDAYRTFSCLMKSHCPRYAQKNLEGVHR